MLISIFGPSNRPRLWPNFARFLTSNQVPYEVVFAGPIPGPLPRGFRFIKTGSVPPQAAACAAAAASGDILVQSVDDIEYSPGALDKMAAALAAEKDVVATCTQKMDGQLIYDNARHWFCGQFGAALPEGMVIPYCGAFWKSDYVLAGGVDKNFIGCGWELDFYLRLLALGRKVVRVDAIADENPSFNASTSARLWNRSSGHDVALLRSLWFGGGNTFSPRSRPVETVNPV